MNAKQAGLFWLLTLALVIGWIAVGAGSMMGRFMLLPVAVVALAETLVSMWALLDQRKENRP